MYFEQIFQTFFSDRTWLYIFTATFGEIKLYTIIM